MPAFIDRTGRKYGRLTVLALAEKPTNTGRKMWVCRCECGKITEARGSDLTTGKTTSCGCFRKEATAHRVTIHGKSKGHPLYQTWQNMKRRCRNPKNIEYHRYGGRGITVCAEWSESYEAFEKWALKSGYHYPLTIDRIDNDKGYSPENCQWLTKSENSKKAHADRRVHNG